jgi:DNA-binding IclR family transcriptional regulator
MFAHYSFDNGRAWPSQETIASDLGIGRESVCNATDRLQAAGFLVRDGKVRRAYRYRLPTDETIDLPFATIQAANQLAGPDGISALIAVATCLITQVDIARAIGLSRETTGGILKTLVGSGLLSCDIGRRGLHYYAVNPVVNSAYTM